MDTVMSIVSAGLGLTTVFILVYTLYKFVQYTRDLQEAWKKLLLMQEEKTRVQAENIQLRTDNEILQKHLTEKEVSMALETEARKRAERQRDELLDAYAKSGSPAAVADGVRRELQALSDLSKGRAPTAKDR